MKKSRKWPLSECIKNYDELVNVLEETEYEIYLDNNDHRLQMWRKK